MSLKSTKLFLSFLLLFFVSITYSQVGIGNTDPKARLDVTATSVTTPTETDGILVPRMNGFPIINPGIDQNGMLIFITGAGSVSEGFYWWDNGTASWIPFIRRIDDLLDGKSDNDGSENGSSVFLGIDSGAGDDSNDRRNTGVGFQALQTSITGEKNSALGYRALNANTGERNTAIGFQSLVANTLGNNNTAVGGQSLADNTTGDSNAALGAFSLANNTEGRNNVAIGNQSLRSNIFGVGNTAIGDYAGRALEINNTAIATNNENVYVGANAGNSDRNASENVYLGYNAGGGTYNINSGTGTLENKSGNIFIGHEAGYNENTSNKLYIENSNSVTPLIYGNFNTDAVEINGSLKVADQNVFKAGKFTATEAAGITAQNGDIIYVTNTGGVFTTRGFWGRENGVWVKL